MANKEVIEGMLYTNPLLLLAIKDEQVIQEINELLPYSTGFDIECHCGIKYNEASFKAIPDIMAVQNDSWEQRYRIPNGLKGIICLYNLCNQLKINSALNPLSSIHYHVDCTDCFDEMKQLFNSEERELHIEYVLSELDTWLGKDTAINRSIGCWFKLNSLKTIEFRLGEMTFEYPIVLKRVLHCNAMVRKFKLMVNPDLPLKFNPVDIGKILRYITTYVSTKNDISLSNMIRRLETLKSLEDNTVEPPPPPQTPLEEMRALIQSRSQNL